MKDFLVSDSVFNSLEDDPTPPKKVPKRKSEDPMVLTSSMVLAATRAAQACKGAVDQLEGVAEVVSSLKAERTQTVRLSVQRDKQGLIEYIDVIPKP